MKLAQSMSIGLSVSSRCYTNTPSLGSISGDQLKVGFFTYLDSLDGIALDVEVSVEDGAQEHLDQIDIHEASQ